MFLINSVFANDMVNTVEAGKFQSFTASLVPLLIFVGVFYFLLIRPQQKKQKQHEEEIAKLKPNDKILTAGGIFATVKKIKEKSIIITVADNVEIEVLSNSVNLVNDIIPENDSIQSKIENNKKEEKKSKNKFKKLNKTK